MDVLRKKNTVIASNRRRVRRAEEGERERKKTTVRNTVIKTKEIPREIINSAFHSVF